MTVERFETFNLDLSIYLYTVKVPSTYFKLTNKEASTVLCSVVKHAGSGSARKKCRENTRRSRVFFPTS